MSVVDRLRFRVHGGQRWLGVVVAVGIASGLAVFCASALVLGVLPEGSGPAALPAGDVVARPAAGVELTSAQLASIAGLDGVTGVQPAAFRLVDLVSDRPAALGAVRLIAATGPELVGALRERGCSTPTAAPRDGVWVGSALSTAVARSRVVVRIDGIERSLSVAGVLDCPAAPGLGHGAFLAADLTTLAALTDGRGARVDAAVVRTEPGAAARVRGGVAALLGDRAAVAVGPVEVVVSAAPRSAVWWLALVAVVGSIALLAVSCALALSARRDRLETLRVLGATSAELRRAVLVELAVPSVLGAAAGVAAGDLVARWSATHLLAGDALVSRVAWSPTILAISGAVVVVLVLAPALTIGRVVGGGSSGVGRAGRGTARAHRAERAGAAFGGAWERTALGSLGRTGRLAALAQLFVGRRMAIAAGVAAAVVVAVGLSTVSEQVDAAQRTAWRGADEVDAWIQAAPPGRSPSGRVAGADRLAAVLRSLRGSPGTTVVTGATSELRVGSVAVELIAPGDGSAQPMWAGSGADARHEMRAGRAVVVTAAAADALDVAVGDRIVLPAPGGGHEVRVAGMVDGGHPGVAGVAMAEDVYRRWFGDRGVSWIEVRSAGSGPVRAERTRHTVERLAAALDRPAAAHPGSYQPLGVRDELRLVASVAGALGWLLAAGALTMVTVVVAAAVLGGSTPLTTMVDLGLEPSSARLVPVVESAVLAVVGVVVGVPAGVVLRGRLIDVVVGPTGWSGATDVLFVRGLLVGAVAVVLVSASARLAAGVAMRPVGIGPDQFGE